MSGLPPRLRELRERAAARYGANPLQLLALIACFALAGYAAGRVFAAGIWIGFLIWFVGAAIFHDFVLFPLYALADVAIRSSSRHRRIPVAGRWPPWINYLRVPAGLSALLLLVWFPLILHGSQHEYRKAVGLDTTPYLGHWLLVTAVLFAGSAVTYALSVRAGAGRPPTPPRHLPKA
ncbi:lipoprotein [Planotetraspora silvatica]|uniref:Lipoprotein n=1 Tax=Planotetraspora silvatica TaxID=234614 RepID=A0A8J3UTX9_9ACTN|nr:hypothetical protein [Planotetraspora silvatica]GII50650.1 lipoprotein [Planotetraspora silvatica]